MRLKLVAAIAILCASVAARADTTTAETYSFSGKTVFNTDTNAFVFDSTSFADFNSSLGTLTGVTLSLSGEVENTDANGNYFYVVAAASNVNEDLISFTPEVTGEIGPYAISVSGTDTYAPDFSSFEGTGTQKLVLEFFDTGTIAPDGVTGTLTYDYTPFAPATTPEPSSIALLGTGLLGAAAAFRKRLA